MFRQPDESPLVDDDGVEEAQDEDDTACNINSTEKLHSYGHPLDVDSSGLIVPGGNTRTDAVGDVYTINRDGLAIGEAAPWQHLSAGNMDDETQTSSSPSIESFSQFVGLDETSLVQAVVFIEDAFKYRSIHHKVDESCLHLYRHYHSTSVHLFRYVVIFTLHILAFFEYPSSLTWTSDIRTRGDRVVVPCWLMESIEFMCLFLLMADNVIRCHLLGRHYFVRHKWDMGAVILLFISVVDWAVSASMGCQEVVRFRRILRPYFIVQNSSLMKKIVNCLRMSLPEVLSVLLMLGMHLYIFTLFGMLLFPTPKALPGHHNRTFDIPKGHINVTTMPVV